MGPLGFGSHIAVLLSLFPPGTAQGLLYKVHVQIVSTSLLSPFLTAHSSAQWRVRRDLLCLDAWQAPASHSFQGQSIRLLAARKGCPLHCKPRPSSLFNIVVSAAQGSLEKRSQGCSSGDRVSPWPGAYRFGEDGWPESARDPLVSASLSDLGL